MAPEFEQIFCNGEVIAIVVRSSFSAAGIKFFTDGGYSQQLGYMAHPAGKIIQPHVHNPVERSVFLTQEVLFIRKGSMRVDFYSSERAYLESRVLGQGDVVLLISGGHGFEVIEAVEFFEVKQGPYVGDADKTRFDGVSVAKVRDL